MMTESEKLDQALTDADARKWRYRAEQAEARALDNLNSANFYRNESNEWMRRAEAALAANQSYRDSAYVYDATKPTYICEWCGRITNA